MDFQALKTTYIAQHWRSIDDTAKVHLNGFAAFCATELAAMLASHDEPEAKPAPEAPGITSESGDAPVGTEPAPVADTDGATEPSATTDPEFPPAA